MTSAERAARNQVRFREANETIDRRRDELGIESDRFPILCECDREECTHVVHVLTADYEEARAHARRFIVLEEHRDGAAILSRGSGYVVIEKHGREGEVVESLAEEG